MSRPWSLPCLMSKLVHALTWQHTRKMYSKLSKARMKVWGINARFSHLYVAYSSVCNCDQVFWSAKCAWLLDCSLLRLLITWFPKVKGQIAAMCPWLLIFNSLGVILIPCPPPPPHKKKDFDHLIQFWSQSQILLHETYSDYPLCMWLHGWAITKLSVLVQIIELWLHLIEIVLTSRE